MLEITLSVFGLMIIFRFLSLLEKFKIISYRKLKNIFLISQIPLYLTSYFKDQIVFLTIYIGIFFLNLMFYKKILMNLAKITYEKRHIQVVDEIILNMKTGKSAQQSVEVVFNQLNSWEKIIFSGLKSNVLIKSKNEIEFLKFSTTFISEMLEIIDSQVKTIEQFQSFRHNLKIRHNLRRKSRQVTAQSRAQAMISVFIYVLILFISLKYFNLKENIEILSLSIFMFLSGITLVFFIGRSNLWKT